MDTSVSDAWLDAIEARLPSCGRAALEKATVASSTSQAVVLTDRRSPPLPSFPTPRTPHPHTLETFDAQELSNILYSVARLRWSPGPQWAEKVLQALLGRDQEPQAEGGHGEGAGAANTEGSNGASSVAAEASPAAAPSSGLMMRRMAEQPRQSSMVAWALRDLGIAPDPSWIAAFDQATMPKASGRAYGALELTSLLLAFAAWHKKPSPEWEVGVVWGEICITVFFVGPHHENRLS